MTHQERKSQVLQPTSLSVIKEQQRRKLQSDIGYEEV